MSSIKSLFLLAVAVFLLSGCSTSDGGIITPAAPIPSETGSHGLLGAWEIRFDPVGPSISAGPFRVEQVHFQVTNRLLPPDCSDCLSIELLNFKPIKKIFSVKVSLRSPANFSLFDVRGIMMTEDPMIEHLNADSFTGLWDNGGNIHINPFKAFATNWPSREFAPATSHARVYEIRFDDLAKAQQLFLLVDVSWPGNCREPYEIRTPDTVVEFLDFQENNIRCEVFSWNEDIESVTVDLGCLGYDSVVHMVPDGGNFWVAPEISWHPGGYEPGTYKSLVSAKCEGSGISTYSYIPLTIDSPENDNALARSWGGSLADVAHGVDIDDAGNIYIIGDYTGEVDFDPSPEEMILTSNGEKDAYLTSFDSEGNFRWVAGFGSIEDETGNCLTTAGDAVYIAGSFIGSVDFDPGLPVFELTANGWRDAFLAAFDTGGNFLWARSWGGDDSVYYDFAHGICTDSTGSIYVTGKFNGSSDFDPGDGVDIHESHGSTDAYLVKYSTDGKLIWAKTWGGPELNKGRDVACSIGDDIWVGGIFIGEVVFDPADIGESVASNGNYDIFLSRFNSSGEYLGTFTFGGISDDQCYSIITLADGSPLLTGYFEDTVDFDPGTGTDEHSSNGGQDIFLIKFAPTGTIEWCRTWGGTSGDDKGFGVTAGPDGGIFLTGMFSGTIDHDPSLSEYVTSSNGFGDAFLSRFDNDGNLEWVRTFGGGSLNVQDFGYCVATDSTDGILVTGGYLWTTDFNPGPGVCERQGFGLYDAYLLRLGLDGVF